MSFSPNLIWCCAKWCVCSAMLLCLTVVCSRNTFLDICNYRRELKRVLRCRKRKQKGISKGMSTMTAISKDLNSSNSSFGNTRQTTLKIPLGAMTRSPSDENYKWTEQQTSLSFLVFKQTTFAADVFICNRWQWKRDICVNRQTFWFWISTRHKLVHFRNTQKNTSTWNSILHKGLHQKWSAAELALLALLPTQLQNETWFCSGMSDLTSKGSVDKDCCLLSGESWDSAHCHFHKEISSSVCCCNM